MGVVGIVLRCLPEGSHTPAGRQPVIAFCIIAIIVASPLLAPGPAYAWLMLPWKKRCLCPLDLQALGMNGPIDMNAVGDGGIRHPGLSGGS